MATKGRAPPAIATVAAGGGTALRPHPTRRRSPIIRYSSILEPRWRRSAGVAQGEGAAPAAVQGPREQN